MEKKMVEISQLLEFFSEKVMEQHEQVEHLYDSAVRSREQVNKVRLLARTRGQRVSVSHVW